MFVSPISHMLPSFPPFLRRRFRFLIMAFLKLCGKCFSYAHGLDYLKHLYSYGPKKKGLESGKKLVKENDIENLENYY